MTKKKSIKRRIGTITFQPDDDIKDEIDKLVKEHGGGRGVRTKLLNDALREKLSVAGSMLLAQKNAREQARRKARGE